MIAWILAEGFRDWSPETWIFVIVSIASGILAAWAKWDASRTKGKQEVMQVQVQQNTDEISKTNDRVVTVASKAVPAEAVQKLLDTPPPEVRKPWFSDEDAKKQD